MQASILGILARNSVPPVDLQNDQRIVEFDHGFVRGSSMFDIHRDERFVCFASGDAAFPSTLHSRDAATMSQARLWRTAYLEYGETAASFAYGRFSAVIVDIENKTIWCTVDRFGTHPLCFSDNDGDFRFSDRADSVLSNDASLSAQAVFDYLFFHMIPAPLTIYDAVRRIPAGHFVTFKQGHVKCLPYWAPTFEEPDGGDFAAKKVEFLSLVRSGVEREIGSHEVGAYLSGGTDSSTVSGMLGKVIDAPARTYSIGFDAAGYDEMEYARIAAKHFGTDHHEYYVTPDDLLQGIPTVAQHYDQPFGNSSAVPAWICAQRAREDGITKILAGDGGDELFGGNTRYAKQRIFGHYEKVPPLLRRAAIEPLLAMPGINSLPLAKKGASYVEQARVPMPDRMQMYNMLLRLGLNNVFERDFLASVDTDEPFVAQRAVWHATNANTQINRILAYDWKYTLADNDLPKVLGTTQLAGLQVGFPLLTDELLDFSTKLPTEWKLKRYQLRWFFKEALRGFLPDEIIRKKKHGFGLPFGVWTCEHDGLKTLASDALASFKHRGIVRPDFIDALIGVHLPAYPGYYGEMVWILMVLEFWIRDHAPDWRASA